MNNSNLKAKAFYYKIGLIVIIQLLVAATHGFRLGGYLDDKWQDLYYSYFSDFVIPFAFYFLLCLNEKSIPVLRKGYIKFLFIFVICVALEIGQYYGYYNVGHTFDPLDIVVYALGAGAALLVDQGIFKPYLWFWDPSHYA